MDFSSIKQQLAPKGVTLVAVSKTKPNQQLMVLYDQGQRIFGENYVQELVDKAATMPKDIAWHFIGHLQSNKVKYIAPFVAMIHSVDSIKLLEEIDKQAKKHSRVVDCLLQYHIGAEDTKFGFALDDEHDWEQIQKDLTNIRLCGVMGMSSFTDDKTQVKKEFLSLIHIAHSLQKKYPSIPLSEVSMGMSDDYLLAIDLGSTMVRIGSLLFGKR
jgi:PLP dependent protein